MIVTFEKKSNALKAKEWLEQNDSSVRVTFGQEVAEDALKRKFSLQLPISEKNHLLSPPPSPPPAWRPTVETIVNSNSEDCTPFPSDEGPLTIVKRNNPFPSITINTDHIN